MHQPSEHDFIEPTIFAITIAFCPAIQLARTILKYKETRYYTPKKHVVVQGYYPINLKKNNRDIQMICNDFGVTLLDPGKNLGSAQSQWWAIEQLGLKDKDYWINVDPDSACNEHAWDYALEEILHMHPNCIVASCNAPMIETFSKTRALNWEWISEGVKKPSRPCPFNLSMWRYSFFKKLGGIPQIGEMWGEVEAAVYQCAIQNGKFHAYAHDYMEDESGKFFQDRQLLEFKDLNMRTSGPDRFNGIYEEYLRWKYPYLLDIDTAINDGTVFQ